jgi:hypothetical protein
MQWHQYGVYKKFSGNVTMPELLKSLTDVQRHSDYNSFRFTITDFLDAKSIDFNESDIKMYGAHVIAGQFTNHRLAIGIVVTNSDVINILKTRYERLVDYEVRYFPTLEECESWILHKTQTTVQFSAQCGSK